MTTRKTLLIADPDALQRQLIDMMFAVDAFDLTLVESAELALAHLREHTPDAVILAVELPDLDGFALCQKVKTVQRLARTPVVLVAGQGDGLGLDESLRHRARLAEADLLLQRPLGDKNLRERLLQLMSTPPAKRDGRLRPYQDTSSLELLSVSQQTPVDLPPGAATELGGLRAEVARLREENVRLKAKLTRYMLMAEQQQRTEEERKRPRGLFGRRQ